MGGAVGAVRMARDHRVDAHRQSHPVLGALHLDRAREDVHAGTTLVGRKRLPQRFEGGVERQVGCVAGMVADRLDVQRRPVRYLEAAAQIAIDEPPLARLGGRTQSDRRCARTGEHGIRFRRQGDERGRDEEVHDRLLQRIPVSAAFRDGQSDANYELDPRRRSADSSGLS